MLDLFFSGVTAYNQVAAFLGGFFCLAIGGGILGNVLYWRLKATRVDATVTGVRQSGKFYYTVYSYMLPATGELIEATSDTGIDAVQKSMATGTPVALLVFPEEPHKVRKAGDVLAFIIAAVFLVPGIVFTGVGISSGRPTGMTLLMIAAFIGYAALKIKKVFIPKGQRLSLQEWKAQNMTKRSEKIAAEPLLHAEDIQGQPVFKANAARNAKNLRQSAPILLVIGALMLCLALYLGQKEQKLEALGVRAAGQVVDMTLSTSSKSHAYYPVVRFRDARGAEHQFKGRTGSSPPSYHVGDDVMVLYLADDAEHSAIIDSGWMNWLPCVLVGLFGAGLLAGSMAAYRAREQAQ